MRGKAMVAAAIATGALAASAAPAQARIEPVPKRTGTEDLARAIAARPSQVTRSFFSVVPPLGNPAAISTTRLTHFPRRGGSFAILSTGNARFADDRNRRGHTGAANLGPLIRGARDVVILRIDLRVPRAANCLTFRFRFLTEEYPEFINDVFNDAFIAEIGESDWDAAGPGNPAITAERNFATDSEGNPIRVNSVGDARMTRRAARGTTYDGATRLLRASTPIRSGRRTLYLSIFDQGDRDYDSAVFIDKLMLTRNGSCSTGVVID